MTIQDRIGKYLASGRSWYTRDVKTITKFSVHHDAIPHDNRSADEIMKSIMNIHNVTNGWPGMSYHYYIHRDGTIYQVNKHEWVIWVDGVNWDALGIVVNGYFHPNVNNAPTSPELTSLKELLDNLATQHPEFPAGQKDVFAHRERAQTACPGDKLFPYVKEYRDKLGQVNWAPVTPTPTPSPVVITDETRIPQIENKTVKEIRENIAQLQSDYTQANNRANDLSGKITKAREALG